MERHFRASLLNVFVICLLRVINVSGQTYPDARIQDEEVCRGGKCGSLDDEFHAQHSRDNKYLLDKVVEAYKEKFGETRYPSEDEIDALMGEMEMDDVSDATSNIRDSANDAYEFPKLVRVDPGQVDDVVQLELEDGKFYSRVTKSVRPPVFEIPDFLTPEECDLIIESAKNKGLGTSTLFGADIDKELNEKNNISDITRISEQTWLRKADLGGDFWNSLQVRLTRLTELDIGIIRRGEPLQVVSYQPGGHYHSHMDSVEASDIPCCIQRECADVQYDATEYSTCCRLCRFITVLYYLNDVEEGGETAFPFADTPDDLYQEMRTDPDWPNLSRNCHKSSLVVRPKRGMAVFWYSHFLDEELFCAVRLISDGGGILQVGLLKTGYLGEVDRRSVHGGCDLIKGHKWIANSWISATTYKDRFKPGIFYSPDP